MKRILVCLVLSYTIACSNQKATEPKMEAPAAEHFYPIGYFFQQQIREVDSLQLPTVKYSEANNSKDTVAISIAEFKALANEFVSSDISDGALKHSYKETSFADQSVPNVTLQYSTTNNRLPVRRIDVILDPNPVMDDQVKSIYIEKYQRSGDTLITKKLLWKANKNFQILTSRKTAKDTEIISQTKVAWDNTDNY